MEIGSTIFILGSGGFAKELETYFDSYMRSLHNTESFSKIRNTSPFKIHFVSSDSLSIKEYNAMTSSSSRHYSIMGSGKCDIKRRMLEEIKAPYCSMVHPSSTVIVANIGKGSVVAPGAILAPRVVLGEHVLANYGVNIGHDSKIGDLSTISPGAFIGGYCILEDGVYVGANASIKEGINIGANSIVAMGSIITKNVPPNSIAIGVPAMVFPLNEWDTIKIQMSSNIEREQNRLRKNFKTI
jgi:sugar O-acyltransferase (sialic acid O-acetyltransferase NeuD family)